MKTSFNELTIFILNWFVYGLGKLNKLKIKINLVEDETREKHFGSYIIIRLIPMLLVIHSIFGNFATIGDTDYQNTKSVIMQLSLVLLAVIWWEITYIFLPTHRIASFAYGCVFGCVLKLLFQQVPLSVCVISSYVIFSSHELLPFDFQDFKEFLIEEPSANEDDQSCIDNKECEQRLRMLSDDDSVSSWVGKHALLGDFHFEVEQPDFNPGRRLDLSPVWNRKSSSSKGIKLRQKERRLTIADELFRNDIFWAERNRKLTIGMRFMCQILI